MAQVVFKTANKRFLADFNLSLTAQMIIKSLPLEGAVHLWGDEMLIETGVQASDVHATMDVNIGEVAYRHEDKRLCVFFGKTPASTADKPVPEFPVVIVGKIACSPEEIRGVTEGESIKVSVVEEKIIPKAPPSSGDRKLSQSEIDELVKKLLAAKSAGHGLKPA